MSREELNNRLDNGWVDIGVYSRISVVDDDQRRFLEAIPWFKELEKQGMIPAEGVQMPDCGTFVVGKVTGLDFVPNRSLGYIGGASTGIMDGHVIVLPAQPAI